MVGHTRTLFRGHFAVLGKLTSHL